MRELRRKDRKIHLEEAISLLAQCQYGILSTVDNEGQPYGVPLNYIYKDNCIYFHCAHHGHKIDNIEDNPRVAFCVVGNTKIVPDKFATEYESAIVFGIASEVHGTERYNALIGLLEKYSPKFIKEGKHYIEQYDKATKVMRIEIEHISGKKASVK